MLSELLGVSFHLTYFFLSIHCFQLRVIIVWLFVYTAVISKQDTKAVLIEYVFSEICGEHLITRV